MKPLNIQVETIPNGWKTATLKDFCEIIMGQSPASSTYNNNQQGLPFFQGKSEFGTIYPTINKYCSHPKKVAPTDSVLLSIRAPVGPTNISRQESCIGRGLAALTPSDHIPTKFILYLIRSIDHHLDKLGTGSTFKAINKAVVEELTFAIPPLAEQRRIVDKIEELLNELDEGIASLNKAKEQLALYRQSLLKHAFEGKLTEEWRKKNADKLEGSEILLKRIKEEREKVFNAQTEKWQEDVASWEQADKPGKKPTKPKKLKELAPISDEELNELPKLPDGWFWNRLGFMTCGVEYGTSAKSKKSGKYPVLRMGNIQECQFDYNDLVYTSDDEEYEKYKLQKGDVLFNRTNSPELVGKTAIFKSNNAALFAGYLIRVNQLPAITNAFYLNYFLNSPIAKQYGNKVKSDGVNQSNINGAKLTNYPFPYCNIEEQKEIAQLLVEKLTSSLNLEKDLNQKIIQTETLRKMILTNAFSGKLTIQDSAEEPASVLLERIKQEKASTPKAKRTRSNKKTPASITMSDLKTVLTSVNDWISAKDAFLKCGIANNASTDEIEKIYEELKQHINAGTIERERRNDEDWLRLTPEG